MCEKATGGDGGGGGCLNKRCIAIVALVVTVFVIAAVLLVWSILRPSHPSFHLQDITVYTFNISTTTPYTLKSYMQVTLSSSNPNALIGVEYQPLDLYATYRDQQVTSAALLPPTFQGHRETVVWSPYLSGDDVPISPYWEQSLAQDLNAGAVRMNIKLQGDLQWKVGTIMTGKYHLYVRCPANIRFGNMIINGGVTIVPEGIKGQPVDFCNVEVAR